jgi:1,4-alpha-glucan branching enzyme
MHAARPEQQRPLLCPAGVLHKGVQYRVMLVGEDGQQLERRDPYARQTDYDSAWCTVDDARGAPPSDWQPPPFDEYLIYEVREATLAHTWCSCTICGWRRVESAERRLLGSAQLHVGSFTPEGTFAAAAAKLGHVAGLGFTAVQLMPICEHSDAWGYNPRQLLAVHGAYGTPDDLRALIRRAHELGLAVIIDVVRTACPCAGVHGSEFLLSSAQILAVILKKRGRSSVYP